MMNKLKNNKGFTLIELLLYISISSVMLFVVVVFFSFILQSRVKNQTIAEVEQQGLSVMQIITQTIRNSEAVISPAAGLSSSFLTLDVVNVFDDPTVFDLSGGAIRIAEGSSLPIFLNNSRVVVSNLVFSNIPRSDTLDIIRIQFTISYINTAGRNEFDYSKTFYGSAGLRF